VDLNSALEKKALVRKVRFLAATGDTDGARREVAELEFLEDRAWPPVLRHHRVWALSAVLWVTGPVDEYRIVQEERCSFSRLEGNELAELHSLCNLVMVDVMLGRFDAAIRDGRELTERFRRRGFAANLAHPLSVLSTALVLDGALDEAVGVLRELFPLLKHEGSVWKRLDQFALIALLHGRKDSAARLWGAAESSLQKFGYGRAMDERCWHDKVSEPLHQAFAPDVLARLMREGAAMSEKQTVAAALAELEYAPERNPIRASL
jgi:hypothetical protein